MVLGEDFINAVYIKLLFSVMSVRSNKSEWDEACLNILRFASACVIQPCV